MPELNRRIVLASHPRGLPTPENFRLETQAVAQPADGEVLLRTHYLSLDPYMRNLMEPIGPGYADPVPLNATMVGGTVSRVMASRHPGYSEGELVLAFSGWQDYSLSDGNGLVRLGDLARPSLALGGLGMPGFTAHVGLADIGQPKAGETVVVAAASGAVGSVVGQLAKLAGARVVGIAGGADKCAHVVDELGFDACLDRRDPHFTEALAQACPQGIDVYFENVGGEVLDAVLPLLNLHARIPLCGFIAHYNGDETQGPDTRARLFATLLAKRVRLQGFIILDHYGPRFDAFRADMQGMVTGGRVKLHEAMTDALENAPAGFIAMLQGRHLGKSVVRVA